MRLAVKKRLSFFVIAISIYTLGFNFIPEELNYDGSLISILPVLLAIIGYFIVLPILHWFLIIKANQDKAWKILIILSISSACARYSFPTAIAEYFEFIAWLRYPIIAVILIIELFLMYTIIKGLWNARKLSGDPRVHAIKEHKDDDKKLSIALTFAWEPASWYYAIPRFSKNHIKKITNLSLASASRLHWAGLTLACILLSGLTYELLHGWSEIVAIILSSIILYSVPFIAANYRVARHYSIYIQDNKLVINNAFWGIFVVELNKITDIEISEFSHNNNKETLKLGGGSTANLRLSFVEQQTYFGGVATFPEKIDQLLLNVEQPQALAKLLKESNKLS
jgi:hypothetical protein